MRRTRTAADLSRDFAATAGGESTDQRGVRESPGESFSERQRTQDIAFDTDQRPGIAAIFEMGGLQQIPSGYGKFNMFDRPPCDTRVTGLVARHQIVRQGAYIPERQAEFEIPRQIEVRL